MKEIELDDTVLIPCPERGFKLRMVKFCHACDFFGGLIRVAEEDDVENSHQVLCKRPITRSLVKMSAD